MSVAAAGRGDAVTHVAVVGLGAMGAATAWRLAQRGVQVSGFDAFDPPHDLGSSHGQSRVIRSAYYEGPEYVPLVQEGFELWRELEEQTPPSGEDGLLRMTGALMIGRPGGELIDGTLSSARRHGLAHRVLDAGELRDRFPQLRPTEGEVGVLEPAAGVLDPERCVTALLTAARRHGATLATRTPVEAVEPHGEGVRVHTATGAIDADQAVIAAGARVTRLVPELAGHLSVERQVTAWFPVGVAHGFDPVVFPVFLHELDGGRLLYGIPAVDGRTVKIAVHHGGSDVDPDDVPPPGEADLEPLRDYVVDRLAGVVPRVDRAAVCHYTNTPDGHFLVDRLPSCSRILVVSACSGHGFKFATVLGDAVADLVVDGRTRRAVGSFSWRRLARG